MLWTVRRSELQPSLWNGIMMLVLGRFSRYSFCLQLMEKREMRKRDAGKHDRSINRKIITCFCERSRVVGVMNRSTALFTRKLWEYMGIEPSVTLIINHRLKSLVTPPALIKHSEICALIHFQQRLKWQMKQRFTAHTSL